MQHLLLNNYKLCVINHMLKVFVEFNSSCCIIHGHFLEKIVFELVFCFCFNEHVFSDWRVCASVCAHVFTSVSVPLCARAWTFACARVRLRGRVQFRHQIHLILVTNISSTSLPGGNQIGGSPPGQIRRQADRHLGCRWGDLFPLGAQLMITQNRVGGILYPGFIPKNKSRRPFGAILDVRENSFDGVKPCDKKSEWTELMVFEKS
jgi:hypothetical protein